MQGQRKVRAIIAAAREKVLAEGLSQAKMSDIATMAKVSTATVYAYFPSKDALFLGVVEDVARDVETKLDAYLYALDGDPIETLARAFLMRLNDPAIRALFRIIAVEGDRFPDIRKVFDTHTRRRAHHAAIALFERLANEGQFEPGAAELASRQLMGMLEHETIILPLLEGQDYAARHDEQMARDATRTLRARFAAIPGRVDAPTVAHPDRKTR
ncbi:TetR/AcrR family transcriptional regulator [Caulobacter segnis]